MMAFWRFIEEAVVGVVGCAFITFAMFGVVMLLHPMGWAMLGALISR